MKLTTEYTLYVFVVVMAFRYFQSQLSIRAWRPVKLTTPFRLSYLRSIFFIAPPRPLSSFDSWCWNKFVWIGCIQEQGFSTFLPLNITKHLEYYTQTNQYAIIILANLQPIQEALVIRLLKIYQNSVMTIFLSHIYDFGWNKAKNYTRSDSYIS